jgi:hypothetical protein
MNNRFTPFFNVDGQGGGDGAPAASESWGDFFQNLDYSNDEQPDMDSDEDTFDETDEQFEQEEDPDQEADDVEEESDEDENQDETDQEEEQEAPVFDDDTEVDLGEGRQPVKLSELKQGYMRQSDYTKKTQELATQRKEVETLQETLKPVQEWQQHMEANPWLWQQINSALQEFNSTGVLPLEEVMQDAQYGKYVNHLMAENSRLTKELDKVSGEFEGVKLSNTMTKLQSDLKGEYGDLVTDEYMSKLQERGKSENLSADTLREIADGYLAKEQLKANQTNVKKETKKAEAKAAQKLAETRKKAPAAPRQTSAKPNPNAEIKSDEDWGDFFRRLSR